MRRPVTVALLTVAYLALVVVLFHGVTEFETWAREAWYAAVTKRAAARVAQVPIDRCILGVYRPELPFSFDGARDMEASLGLRFTLVSLYQAWSDAPEGDFPLDLMDAVDRAGCVPVLTWEPWVTAFTREGLKTPGTRDHRCLKDIADGVYDFHLIPWAREAVAWGKPFFLRFAHEMSNAQYPWTPVNGNRPDDFIRAWWHVRALFDSLGARNVIWVWSPYRPDDVARWPGDSLVDWIGVDIFNYGDALIDQGDIRWRSFDQLMAPLYRVLTPLRKPIMIAEAGCSDMGGDRAVWYREMFAQLRTKYTGVKALVFFENPADRTSGRQEIDWSIGAAQEIMDEARSAARSCVYLDNYSQRLRVNHHQ